MNLVCVLAFCVLAWLMDSSQCECQYPQTSNSTFVFSKQSLTVGTFNAYWLFDGVKDSSNVPWSTAQAAQEHVRRVAQQIHSMDADVMNLVEVESCSVVNQVVQEYGALCDKDSSCDDEETYSVYLKQGTDTATRQNVAMISKLQIWQEGLLFNTSRVSYPIENSKCGYTGSSTSGVSKHYFTWMNISFGNGVTLPLLLVGVHFKAIPTQPASCAQREAQATVIQNGIRHMLHEAGIKPEEAFVIVMGDLNDYDNDIRDVSDSTPTSSVLRILKDNYMVNVLQHVPTSQRYTHWYDENDNKVIDSGELSTLDHILVSSRLLQYVSNVTIHNDLYPTGNLNISDHWPMTVTIDMARLSKDLITKRRHPDSTMKYYLIAGIFSMALLIGALAISLIFYKRFLEKRSLDSPSQHKAMHDEEIDQLEMIDSDEELTSTTL